MSDALRTKFDTEQQHRFALSGGDDYELCFTANASVVDDVAGITRIGSVTAGPELICRHHGDVVQVDFNGYRHFQ